MDWTHIMIHHSLTKDGEAVSWGAIRDFHIYVRHWEDIGYHFGVELVGKRYEALVGRPLTMHGAHCYQQGMNSKAIGICCVGNYDMIKPPQEMLAVLGYRLIMPLMKIYNIPTSNVVFHREYAEYKSCPGAMFNKTHFVRWLEDML